MILAKTIGKKDDHRTPGGVAKMRAHNEENLCRLGAPEKKSGCYLFFQLA